MTNKPQPFFDALLSLKDKEPTGSPFRTAEWSAQSADVRTKAFFSAGVENVRFLERAQSLLIDYQERATEEVINPTTGEKETILKVGSRADFVRRIREFMVAEGMTDPDDFLGSQTDLTDITQRSRLQLIFDTNTRQAFGFGRWKQSMSPAVLDAYPAARFIRHSGSEEKRPRHEESEGEVRMKTDDGFWADFQNGADIGGFEVPWGPYGFNSHMDQEDVPRAEAEELGLIDKGERVRRDNGGVTLIEKLKASLNKLSPDLRKKLRAELKKARIKTKVTKSKSKDKAEVIEVVVTPPAEDPRKTLVRRMEEALPDVNDLKLKWEDDAKDVSLEVDRLLEEFKKIPYPSKDDFVGDDGLIDYVRYSPAVNAWSKKKDAFDKVTQKLFKNKRAILKKKSVAWADFFALPESERGAIKVISGRPRDISRKLGLEVAEKVFHKDLMVNVLFKGTNSRGLHTARKKIIPKSEKGNYHLKDSVDMSPVTTKIEYGQLKISPDLAPSVTVHEIAHQIENRHLEKQMRDFLKKRANGEKLERLKDMTGIVKYKNGEVAYRDKFKERGGDHYMGKWYKHGSTEILTRGIERILGDPLGFEKRDPEYFWLIYDAMRGNL